MRIASTQYHTTMSLALDQTSAKTAELLQQMSSGKRLLLPSDDPIASVRLLRLGREEAALGQYRDNIASVRSKLSVNESYLAGMGRDMLDMRDLLLMALEGSYTAQDLRDMAGPLQSLRDSLFYAANTKDQEGRHLFSGTAIAQPTLSLDAAQPAGSRYSFTGNSQPQQVMVGHGVTQAANVTLEHLPDFLNSLDATIAVLQDPALNPQDPATGSQLRATLQALDVAHNRNTSKISQLGSSQNTLQMMADNHGNVSLSNQQSITQLESLDYAQANINMNSYMLALQSSQKAYGRVSSLTLFDVL
ncbi:flagellar hook-associated protein FlgL [Vogesella indigofera]|uniref:flagellar hook-associated protein FlgL n=1 Tax=Vogesella indigofera TaxID=45465 RepID=UPI00234EBB92|nr:flagellar hook-associated protein FlgL [Vogesella indigofera]MDC7710129.1 flagellar hook-associated protein FlgL [Vogesella indigofera]